MTTPDPPDYQPHLDAWALDIASTFPLAVVKRHLPLILSRAPSAHAKEQIQSIVNSRSRA